MCMVVVLKAQADDAGAGRSRLELTPPTAKAESRGFLER